MVSISVVTPVYNSEKIIEKFYFNLIKSLKKTRQTFEIILVNDCSTDGSKKIIQKIIRKDTKLINLKKNIGQHHALLKGLKEAKGNTIITLDSDMQDDPNYIKKNYLEHIKSKKIQMISLKKDKNLRNVFSLIFWNILGIFFFRFIHTNPSNYLFFSKQDLYDLLKMKKNFLIYLDFLIIKKKIMIVHGIKLSRKDKKTSYNFKKLFILSLRLLLHYNYFNKLQYLERKSKI
jgi:glycosyltransferase involved in cell wall biosynthesis